MDAERRLLLTGFEPWADHAANPAEVLARRLDGWRHRGWRVCGVVLPVALDAGPAVLTAARRDLRPHAVLHLGLAASRPGLTVERWAHNVADFPLPDNRGAQPRGEPLAEDGPTRLAATLPVAAAVHALAAAGVPATPSASAGQFVCNAVLYASLRWAAAARFAGPVGFVHLPSPQTLALDTQERALERLLRWLVAAQL
ncbi:MAG: pyroglutamyl-peptidase I [Chloroflexi bacterium]|nr:pyroglutamyl-peptidase I [Chloroflexota bacterium]